MKPAVTVLEATERMLCRLWTMIDESSFRVGMLQNIGKSGRPLTDGNIETIGNINSILSRKMMHVELPDAHQLRFIVMLGWGGVALT